jgi:hypothetical protein
MLTRFGLGTYSARPPSLARGRPGCRITQRQAEWEDYLDRVSLEWWGQAALAQRQVVDPFAASPALTKTPS